MRPNEVKACEVEYDMVQDRAEVLNATCKQDQ